MKFIKGNEYLYKGKTSSFFVEGKKYKCSQDGSIEIENGYSTLYDLCDDFKLIEPTPEYYNNENGSIYALQVTRSWNSYTFDIVKRLERAEHKGEFLSDIDKCIKTLNMYKEEQGHRFEGQFEKLNINE